MYLAQVILKIWISKIWRA